MPSPELHVSAPWLRRDGLLLEPRLAARGVAHGFTTRALGDMKSEALRKEACARAGLGAGPLVFSRQEHGARVFDAADSAAREGDGWICKTPGLAVGVFSADCLPALFWDDSGTVAAAVHAGWRGLAAGVLESALRAFAALGVTAGRLSAALGPHIGPCCYEVGPELRTRFAAGSFRERGGRLFLDLGEEAACRLRAAGLGPDNLSLSADCTACGREEFYSFRRDGGRASHLSFIAPQGNPK